MSIIFLDITLARFFYFKSLHEVFFQTVLVHKFFFLCFPLCDYFCFPPQPLHFSNGPPLNIPYFNTFCLWKHHVNLYCSSDKFTWCFHKQKVIKLIQYICYIAIDAMQLQTYKELIPYFIILY